MKRTVVIFAVLILAGFGCTKSETRVGQPASNVPANAEETLVNSWNRIRLAEGEYIIALSFPGALASRSMSDGQILEADIGTSVENPGERAVPRGSLKLFLIDSADARMTDCAFSENERTAGRAPDIRAGLSFTDSSNLTFCESKEEEGAAGNRYAIYTYATPVGEKILALEFIVHSLACENFENPEAQCVAFDEARDTAVFGDILSSVEIE